MLKNINSNQITFLKHNNDLILKFDESNQITIKNHF